MFYLNVYDSTSGKAWVEYFEKWSELLKREDKLKYSKRLFSLSKGSVNK